MTENEVNEALERHKKDCRKCRDKACKYGIDCLQKIDIEVYEELLRYRAIGTVEELKLLQLQNHLGRDEALVVGRKEGYNKAIDDFVNKLNEICDKYPITTGEKHRPLYAHTDGTWHDLIDDVVDIMKEGVK